MEAIYIMANSNSHLNSLVYGSSFAILVSAGINFLTPSYGVDRAIEPPFHEFHIYRLGNLFVDSKKKEKPKPKVEKPKEKVYDLKKWKLQATYIGDSDMFAIIADGKEMEIVPLDYIYKGYELVDLKEDEAIFRRKGKLYSLKLEEKKRKSKRNRKEEKDLADKILENEKREEQVKIEASIDPETNEITSAKIRKSDIDFYLKNIDEIWKNIRLIDYRENRRLRGFRVVYLKHGSKFEKLGLRKGDIIIAINGEKIRSYAQVQKYYKNIRRIRQLSLTILRNGEEKEIDYEVH
ncbi:MAG TPA: PDZ domain-containing protein [Campylobacterales bacterium]|nr:PDZ domain-containing protein [Campylobacterales bacterium]HIO71213.1 PDZ domain-containing protein [Campylobacterales bacterium]